MARNGDNSFHVVNRPKGPSINDVGRFEGGRGVSEVDMGRYDGGGGKKNPMSAIFNNY